MVFSLYGKEVGVSDIRVIDQLRVRCREQLRNYWTNRVIFPVRQKADFPTYSSGGVHKDTLTAYRKEHNTTTVLLAMSKIL